MLARLLGPIGVEKKLAPPMHFGVGDQPLASVCALVAQSFILSSTKQ